MLRVFEDLAFAINEASSLQFGPALRNVEIYDDVDEALGGPGVVPDDFLELERAPYYGGGGAGPGAPDPLGIRELARVVEGLFAAGLVLVVIYVVGQLFTFNVFIGDGE